MDADHAIERRQQFENNWAKHYRQLKRYILRNVRNEADAEELADQTLIDFFQFMEERQWKAEIMSVTAYLYGIARKLCAKFMSRRNREMQLDSEDEEQGEQIRRTLEKKAMQENNPISRYEDGIGSKELWDTLPRSLWAELSEYELLLLYLHIVMEMSAEEISKELGKDVCRVRYDLNKLMAKLRYRARQLSK